MTEQLFDKFIDTWNEAKSNPLVNAARGAQQVDAARVASVREGNRSRVLNRLRASEWVSTSDLIEITHRFSASIHELRQLGHTIVSRTREDGSYEWRHEAYTPMEIVSDLDKERYYRSGHWKSKRLERLEFDSFLCCWCKADDHLHVHHWRYDLFCERLFDLMTLCTVCHDRIHELTEIHFPKTVPTHIKQRLAEPDGSLKQLIGGVDSDTRLRFEVTAEY